MNTFTFYLALMFAYQVANNTAYNESQQIHSFKTGNFEREDGVWLIDIATLDILIKESQAMIGMILKKKPHPFYGLEFFSIAKLCYRKVTCLLLKSYEFFGLLP